MQKQTSLYIPKPCHEDWNKMTATQQGKFCGSCNKQVVDFSLMSDNQILNFLSNQSGRLCGRLDAEQLQRPLIETKIKKKKGWWIALTMPLLFLFERSEAQKIVPKQKHTVINSVQKQNVLVGDVSAIVADTIQPSADSSLSEQLIGKVAICEPPKPITITGKVIDEKGDPLAFASIYQKGTMRGTSTDSIGNFSIKINSNDSTSTLFASYIGYETNEITINQNQTDVIITMRLKPITAGEIIVIGYATKFLGGRVGGISVCRKITVFQKFDSSFKKAIGISNVYPNPVLRGNLLHVKIKNAGNYQIQLLDNQSRLIKTEEINANAEKSTTQVQLPSNIAAGIYYLRLINEQTKKSYTEKLVIQ